MKSTYSNDATRSIYVFLSFICLSSVTWSNTELVQGVSFARFFLFCSFYVITITFSIMQRSLEPIDESTQSWFLHDYLNSSSLFIGQFFIFANFLTCYLSKDFSIHQEYFSNYLTLDRVLKVPSVNRKKSLEAIFFAVVGVYILKMAVELWFYFHHSDHIIASFVIIVILMSLIPKLIILQDMFERYVEDVTAAIKNLKTKERNGLNGVQTLKKYRRCYQLIYKQLFILHQVHGWQMLLIFLRTLLMLVTSTNGLTESLLASFNPNRYVPVLAYAALSSMFVTMATRIIENMGHLRTTLQLHLEETLAHLESQNLQDGTELHQLSLFIGQVSRQPLVFSVCGMFDLNYNILHSVVAITISYTVVFAQLNVVR